MGGPTQGKAVAIPLPSLQLLERCVGKGVNRSFKNRQVAAARLIRRVAEAKPLITAADVFFQVTRYAADAGKPARAGIIPANKNTNRLVVIAGLIEKSQLHTPSDDVRIDSPALEIRNSKGGTAFPSGEAEGLFLHRFPLFPAAGSCIMRNSRGAAACQPFHSLYKAVPADFHEVIHGIDLSSTAVPVPVIFTRHINQAVMLIMTIIGAFLFQHTAFVRK